jgi:hypothetical protein
MSIEYNSKFVLIGKRTVRIELCGVTAVSEHNFITFIKRKINTSSAIFVATENQDGEHEKVKYYLSVMAALA